MKKNVSIKNYSEANAVIRSVCMNLIISILSRIRVSIKLLAGLKFRVHRGTALPRGNMFSEVLDLIQFGGVEYEAEKKLFEPN